MSPVLSLVTGTLDRPESLKRLVYSIQECTTVDWELIIADASQDISSFDDSRIRVLEEKPRLGCVAGFNRAFAHARGTYVIYLNDDAEVLPHYDTNAIRLMEDNPEIGLGCLYYSEKGGPFKVNHYLNIPYANFGIVRRSVGNEIGWFGNALTMYGCDNVITLEVLLAGHGVAEIRNAKVVHHSVQDQHRIENQKYRRQAGEILERRYRPFYGQIRAQYRKHQLVHA